MPQLPAEDRVTAVRRRGRPGYDVPSVLAVAVEVFNERGYDRTSMEISRAGSASRSPPSTTT